MAKKRTLARDKRETALSVTFGGLPLPDGPKLVISGAPLQALLAAPPRSSRQAHDVAIVGLGAAGGVLASVLAYQNGLDVAGIDAGTLPVIRTDGPPQGDRTLFESMRSGDIRHAGEPYVGYSFAG